jgi:hypothetical protein
VELRYNGVLYRFDYDFAPSDETGAGWTPILEECGLDGSIHVHSITVNGKDRLVTTEVLALMQRAAAIEEFTTCVESSVALYRNRGLPLPPRLLQYQEVVSRLEQTS